MKTSLKLVVVGTAPAFAVSGVLTADNRIDKVTASVPATSQPATEPATQPATQPMPRFPNGIPGSIAGIRS